MREEIQPHRPASPEEQQRKRGRIDRRESTYRKAKELEGQVQVLEERADVDGLTGLLNRRAFEVRARAALEGLSKERRAGDASRRLGIIFCDIDHFKSINDTFGHAAGDEVLRQVASTLRRNVRPEDIVGRWGGEEFAICVVDGDHNQLAKIADGLRSDVENSVRVEGRAVTMSFGVEAIIGSEDLETAIEHADHALYESKNNGRNRVTFAEAA